jgi:hypothetical protein
VKNWICLLSFLCVFVSHAQLTNTIRGTVIDAQSKMPLPGASVQLIDSVLKKGVSADMNGHFKLVEIPVGRISLKISFVGYNPRVYNNLELTSGKELILHVELEETVIMAREIEVIAKKEKDQTNNEMATVSGRTFSIEESKRYAGSVNDVARMAQNFAGVQGADDSRNDIIVRGNSPIGVLYRYEGIDIPNPNHFALLGTAGGPVSILNNNVLANSDFLTAAFPAEYGNALAAVFDLKMRNGNNQRHEFLGQIGLNGLEFMAEGPISKEKFSSYLLSYRYSTLDLFAMMGFNFGTGTSIPTYQDLNLKLHFPNKKGYTSVFGIGGLSAVVFENDPTDNSTNFFVENTEDLSFYSRIGAAGVQNLYRFSSKLFLKTTLATSATYNQIARDSIIPATRENFATYRNKSLEGKNSLNSQLSYKANARNLFKLGLVADRLFFDVADSIYRPNGDFWATLTSFKGASFLIQPYAQWQLKLSEKLTFNSGVHYQHFVFNNSFSLEPRAGIRYKINELNHINLGYGKHSQLPPTRLFFEKTRLDDGSYATPNENIGMTKAHHFVLGYDRRINENTRIKTEVYYQKIDNVPVDVRLNSYSLLNYGANFNVGFPDSLQNLGTGTNYGFELTLERFLTKGMYYLVTVSLYESKYTGSNGVEFGTAFNGNYTFNALAGKEFFFQSKKDAEKPSVKSLLIDWKITLNGGQRYTPVDAIASMQNGVLIYDYSRSFEGRYPDYFRSDLRLAFKLNRKKSTQEWAVDIRNITNHKNIFTRDFNPQNGKTETTYQIGFLPIAQYRIEF